jgi:hypothetical protein
MCLSTVTPACHLPALLACLPDSVSLPFGLVAYLPVCLPGCILGCLPDYLLTYLTF